MKNKLIDIYIWILSGVIGAFVLAPNRAFAFSKLKAGFETITNNYLIPLLYAVSGAAFIFYVIYSLFKQDEKKKIGEVAVLSIIGAAGLDLINKLMQSFS